MRGREIVYRNLGTAPEPRAWGALRLHPGVQWAEAASTWPRVLTLPEGERTGTMASAQPLAAAGPGVLALPEGGKT